jgi:hypothetical protein
MYQSPKPNETESGVATKTDYRHDRHDPICGALRDTSDGNAPTVRHCSSTCPLLMEPSSFSGHAVHSTYRSPDSNPKLAQQSPAGDEHEWSGEGSSADEERGSKRKRPLSVSCEICKQRKVRATTLYSKSR